jgi:Flp pilus assembly protein TadG
LVELAVVLPVLAMLVIGILQFGLVFNKYITLTDAVRGGARTLALGRGLSDPCDPAVTQTVQAAVGTGLTASQVTPSFASSSDYCGSGSYVYETSGNTSGNENQGDEATVTATYPYTLSLFGVPVFSFNLTSSASDAIE